MVAVAAAASAMAAPLLRVLLQEAHVRETLVELCRGIRD
eukprot:CAMPEP_0197498892 /NCGR_PEP_ID=MMETSP1311-20131121/60601_1 /TAXON_ID=464262 /ORGANISM="Genus nov. species nov., Strain RCC856" /LENGTH=38 /DNA_ID= /DNA_START= /DNA_END= /DNA_ORIENTATION=